MDDSDISDSVDDSDSGPSLPDLDTTDNPYE